MSKITQKDSSYIAKLKDILCNRSNVHYVYCNNSAYEDNFEMSIYYKSGAILDMCFEDARDLALEYIR